MWDRASQIIASSDVSVELRSLARERGSRLGVLRLGSPVLGFAIQAILTIYLGVEGLGQYAVFTSIAAFIAMVVTLGMPASLSRELAIAETDHDRSQLAVSSLTLTVGVWAVVGVLVLAFGRSLLEFFGLDGSNTSTLLTAALVGGMALQSLSVAAARGYDKLTVATLADLAINKILLLVGLLIMGVGLVSTTVPAALALTAVAGLGPILAVAARLRTSTSIRATTPDMSKAFRLARHSWALLFHQLVYAISTSVALWILSRSGDSEAAGVFHLVERLALMVAVPGVVIQFLFGVPLAQAIASGNPGNTELRLRGAVARASLAAVVLALAFFAIHPILFLLLTGENYGLTAAVPLAVLIIGQVFTVATGPCGYTLIMGKRETTILATTTMAAVVATILSVALAPSLGATGAAIASTAGVLVVNVLNVVLVRRQVGMNTVLLLR